MATQTTWIGSRGRPKPDLTHRKLAGTIADVVVVATIFAACVSAAAVVAVGYLANSLHRQLRHGVQERRLAAYEGLWAVTRVCATIRARGQWAGGPLTEDERRKLFNDMTHWYYGKSGGIYLTPNTRSLFLKVKGNLLCPVAEIEPDGALDEFPHTNDINKRRGQLALRQISLLRWVMRFDLDIHTKPYHPELTPREMRLLNKCGINLNKKPFKGNFKHPGPTATSKKASPPEEARPESGLAL